MSGPATQEQAIQEQATQKQGHCDSEKLCMPAESRAAAARRLKVARGHIEAIIRMLDDEAVYCVDVLRQIKAVQGALGGAGDVVLRGHLESHVVSASERGDAEERVDELMQALRLR